MPVDIMLVLITLFSNLFYAVVVVVVVVVYL